MDKKIKIGASLICANFAHLEKDIHELEKAGVDYIHFDIMDGHFVPNYCLNLDFLRLVKSLTDLPVDVHLMIDNPDVFIPVFAKENLHALSFQQETEYHIQRQLAYIREQSIKSGLAVSPATPLNVYEYLLTDIDVFLIMTVNPGFAGQKIVPATIKKVEHMRNMLEKAGISAEIQVDGNVSFENIPQLVSAGATMLVGGTSSVFKKGMTITDSVEKIRDLMA